MPIHPTCFENCEILDRYVNRHPKACLYQLSGWARVIQQSYGHNIYSISILDPCDSNKLSGVLTLAHLKHPLFGNSLVSMPYADIGGTLSDTPEAEDQLLAQAIDLAHRLGASIELRHTRPLSHAHANCTTRAHKSRMLLKIPDSSESLMRSFKSKLRSQINRPIKDGLTSAIGGVELVDEFYKIFLENMRDLGSPVHSKRLFQNVMAEFPNSARIFIVRKGSQALASSLAIGFNDTLQNPWSSSLRRYSHFSPNMLLYWSMLEYAADNGFSLFDFGRSTPGEGTYKFKEQWGAKPEPLYWQTIGLGKAFKDRDSDLKKSFQMAGTVWKHLPIVLTRIVGPSIRKYISL